jgi:hypothetical protein
MKFFVYFDAYGHAGQAIDENELADQYQNSPDLFLRAMCRMHPDTPSEHSSGHVGTLIFENKKELYDYLESLGDEITGFFGCRSQSRPYNF